MSLEYAAFYNCAALERFNSEIEGECIIPSGITSISDYAFFGCSSLVSVEMHSNIETISIQAFYGCSGLISVVGCDGLVAISEGAFYNCNSLKYFNSLNEGECIIPASVTSIGIYVFRWCDGLTSITFEDPDGWYLTSTENGESEIVLTLTSDTSYLSYFTSLYRNYYWYKSVSE